jgi:hypothetical protein
MFVALLAGLTFDVSGRPKAAKQALGCPLDGGVRRLQVVRSEDFASTCIVAGHEASMVAFPTRSACCCIHRCAWRCLLGARGTDDRGTRSLQRRKVGWRNEDTYRPSDTWSSFELPSGFERDDHLMGSWRRHCEILLNVCLGRWTTIDLAVVIDEGEVLALTSRECGLHCCVCDKGSNVRHER